MLTLDHVGIAVEDLETSISLYEDLLGQPPSHREIVESQKVEVAFFQTGATQIELIASTDPTSAIARFLERKGPGMQHMAYKVSSIEQAMQIMAEKGYELIDRTPRVGAQNKLICFLHPRSTQGVLIELCQHQKEIG